MTFSVILYFKIEIRRLCLNYKNDFFRLSKIEKLDTYNGKNVLIGNSLVKGFKPVLDERIGAIGMSGETINGITELIDADKISPTKSIAIWIGINDVLFGNKIERISRDYNKLFLAVKNLNIRVIVLAIPKVKLKKDGFFVKNNETNNRIEIINIILEVYCQREGFFFLELEEINNLHGNFRINDGVHLNVDAYNIVNQKIISKIDSL